MGAVAWGKDDVLVATPLRTQMLVPTWDLSLSPLLAAHGTHHEGLVAWMEQHLQPGMTFVDVGAHIGFITVMAGRLVGNEGRVIAYEPNPALADYLERNVALNFVGQQVTIVEKAAHRDARTRKLMVDPAWAGGGSLVLPEAPGKEAVSVRCERLDKGPAAGLRIDVLKIDAEGGEVAVLEGMGDLSVGTISLEYRTDVMPEGEGPRMKEALSALANQGGRFADVDTPDEPLSLSDVVHRGMFENLLVQLS